MPRFMESCTWNLLQDVPANCKRLVMEVLSLRQKIVLARQATRFLRRCRDNDVIPNFIRRMRLHEVCGQPKDGRRVHAIAMHILKTAIRSKQDHLYSLLLKCTSKELYCQQYVPLHLWRRIVSKSKDLCKFIRAKTKVKLQDKFTRLVEQRRGSGDNTATNHKTLVNVSGDAPSRVTIIGDVALSDDALSVLNLGPSFAPSQYLSQNVCRKIISSLESLHHRLRRQARMESGTSGLDSVSLIRIPPPPFPATSVGSEDPNSVVDSKFRVFTNCLLLVLQRYKRKRSVCNLEAKQKRGLKELRSITSSGTVKIGVSDKGGEFVVMPKTLDNCITRMHLQDSDTYSQSTREEFVKQYRRINRKWTEIGQAANLPKSLISRLKFELPSCPVLYLLIKTHKLSPDSIASCDPSAFKVRPIISGVGGPTDKISWLVNLVLCQLLKFLPAHLPNTQTFVNKLQNTRLDGECAMESFDVTSLYTNIPKDSALQALLESLTEHQSELNLHGLSIGHIMTLVNECLMCNTFRWSGQYYKQVRGLAMGHRLAPVLAVTFMSKIESPVLARMPLAYYRYIDDCFIVCSTQVELDKCFELLNSQNEHIKITREKPSDGWLPFLNVQVCVVQGVLRTKWYRKPSSKNILVHRASAHPSSTKRAIIGNMFRTAVVVSSGSEEKAASLELACQVARANGYNGDCRKSHGHKRRDALARGCDEDQAKIVFCIPFLTDEFSSEVRSCIRKADLHNTVRLVEIPPSNLKRHLTNNRLYDNHCLTPHCVVCPYGKQGDCMIAGVVYLIRCHLCGAEYVGETGRPLCVRVKEHLQGLNKSQVTTPLGEHRVRVHNNELYQVSVTVLSREVDIVARRTLEALWINCKDPRINRKEERVAVTEELTPFIDFCGFRQPPDTS